MLFKIKYLLILLSLILINFIWCLEVINNSPTDITVLVDKRIDPSPINITLYKNDNFTDVQYVIKYNCSKPIGDSVNELCNTSTTIEESQNIWGSSISGCVVLLNGTTQCNSRVIFYYPAMYPPYIFNYSRPLGTRGGLMTVNGMFMRMAQGNISNIFFRPNNFDSFLRTAITPDYINGVYNPNKLHINFAPGYGNGTLCFDRYIKLCASVPYLKPTISNATYDYSNKISIIGENFYKSIKITKVNLGNETFSGSSIASVDHELIVLNYPSNYTEVFNVIVSIDGTLSNSSVVTILPNIISTFSNVTKYHDGMVIINGTNLIPNPNNTNQNIKISIGNEDCLLINELSSFTSVSCKLTKNNWGLLKYPLKYCSGGLCNTNGIMFEYPKPIISSITNNGSYFTIVGQNLGNYVDKSTIIYINYNGIEKSISLYDNSTSSNTSDYISSISDDETLLTFKVSYFCGNANIHINVNGANSSVSSNTPTPIINVESLPSTNGKDLLSISLLFFKCIDYNTAPNFIYGNSKTNGILIKNGNYSFNIGKGTGFINGTLKFANQDFNITTSYQYPKVYSSIFSDTLIILNGTNFGTDSNLCQLTYNNSIIKNCTVVNDNEIRFNLINIKKEISANLIININGLKGEYILESVQCQLYSQETSYPSYFGCLGQSYISYNCNNLGSFINESNLELITSTFNNKTINHNSLIIKGNNISIPVPSGSKSSKLNLLLNNVLLRSFTVSRKNASVANSLLLNDEQNENIKLTINGSNIGEPYQITIANITFTESNCTIQHGSNKTGVLDQDCKTDILICVIPQQYKDNLFNITNIPYKLMVGDTILNLNTSVVVNPNNIKDKNNAVAIGCGIGIPIGALLIGTFIFGGYKYHQNKKSKETNTGSIKDKDNESSM